MSPDRYSIVIPAKGGLKPLSPRERGWGEGSAELHHSARSAYSARAFACFATLLLALLLPLITSAQATDPAPLQFTSAAEEARFHDLVAELRCVMCQNQSLADSDALIAQDLRREVLSLIRQGRTDAEVKQYLVARYGEFVLYRPQVKSSTWLLWFGPVLLLAVGGIVVARVVRKRHGSRPVAPDDSQEW